ncbi:hypothetical protein U9K47_15235 [Bacillus toyonensis]|uniref:hypothetical protein n=1 Tax=Bacillus toyonensis TaxID=155322 RepID=UPI003465CC93
MKSLHPKKYEKNNEWRHIGDPNNILLEGKAQSAATIEYTESVHANLSFCGMVHVPHGFIYVPNSKRQLTYSLAGLFVVNETSQRTIVVDDCGPVDVALNVLKLVGNIPFIATAMVQGDNGTTYDSSPKQENQIHLSYTDNILVDTILKLSVASLPAYSIQGDSVKISDFQVTPLQDQGANLLRFTGTFSFQNIPQ